MAIGKHNFIIKYTAEQIARHAAADPVGAGHHSQKR
jgi:hypothetical protein